MHKPFDPRLLVRNPTTLSERFMEGEVNLPAKSRESIISRLHLAFSKKLQGDPKQVLD